MKAKDPLSYKIIGCAMEVYNTLGPGLLEAAYEKALIHELELNGLSVASQVKMAIRLLALLPKILHKLPVASVNSWDGEMLSPAISVDSSAAPLLYVLCLCGLDLYLTKMLYGNIIKLCSDF